MQIKYLSLKNVLSVYIQFLILIRVHGASVTQSELRAKYGQGTFLFSLILPTSRKKCHTFQLIQLLTTEKVATELVMAELKRAILSSMPSCTTQCPSKKLFHIRNHHKIFRNV